MRYFRIFGLLLTFSLVTSVSQAQILRSIDSAYFVFQEAEDLFRNRQYQEALTRYNQAVELESENDIYLFGKGECHLVLKEYEKAMFTLAKATKLHPDYAKGHASLAKAYQKLGRTDSMVKSLQNAFNYEDNEHKRLQYQMLMVDVLMKAEKYAQALPKIGVARGMKPDSEQLLFYEGKAANRLGKYELAKVRLETATRMLRTTDANKRAAYFFELGYAYFHLGKPAKAREVWKEANYGKYRKLIAQYNPAYYYHIASAYFEIYDYQNAEKNLFQTLKLDNNYTQAYLMLAQIQERRSMADIGLAYYQTALNSENQSFKKVKILRMVAYKMMEGEIFDKAVEMADNYLVIYPEERNILYLKALALHHLNEYEAASQILEHLIKHTAIDHKTKVKYHFVLGEIYKKAKHPEKAKFEYRSARHGTFFRAADEEYGKIVDILTIK